MERKPGCREPKAPERAFQPPGPYSMSQAEVKPDRAPFERREFDAAPKSLLHVGRSANALVWRTELGGRVWTVKDFAVRNRFVRGTIAPGLVWREVRAAARLHGIDGITDAAFRIDGPAAVMAYIDGRSLNLAPREAVTVEYLERLERLIGEMHARDVVHLDLRGRGNVLVRSDGTPAIIDFQSALFTDRMPARLRRTLEDIDLSGAFKKWLDYQPDAMGEERRRRLERINSIRRLWFFRGYCGIRRRK